MGCLRAQFMSLTVWQTVSFLCGIHEISFTLVPRVHFGSLQTWPNTSIKEMRREGLHLERGKETIINL